VRNSDSGTKLLDRFLYGGVARPLKVAQCPLVYEWGELLVCDVGLAYGRRMTGVPDHLLEKSCESWS